MPRFNKFLHALCWLVVTGLTIYFAIDLLTSGIRIMFFGFKMVISVIFMGAMLYMAWHAGRFFRKK